MGSVLRGVPDHLPLLQRPSKLKSIAVTFVYFLAKKNTFSMKVYFIGFSLDF